MKTNHTPGPWEQSNRLIFGSTAAPIATVHKHQSPIVTQANASLIAAAPELLEALREQDCFLGVLSGTVPLTEKGTHRRIAINREAVRATIAKATGSAE
jgi:hypothetical protein